LFILFTPCKEFTLKNKVDNLDKVTTKTLSPFAHIMQKWLRSLLPAPTPTPDYYVRDVITRQNVTCHVLLLLQALFKADWLATSHLLEATLMLNCRQPTTYLNVQLKLMITETGCAVMHGAVPTSQPLYTLQGSY
jgi:hypothetical protein